MISLFKKPIPVEIIHAEIIHAEFDSAETRILDQCDKILAELKILTESQIEKKADMLYKLGFVNSEVIQQASILKQRTLDTKNIIDITSKQAESIRYLKSKYPLEKFITINELNRICEKYKLIHAPAANYIKDIPEKNVLEMTNCKKLEKDDKLSIVKEYVGIKNPKFLLSFLKKDKVIISEYEIRELSIKCDYHYNSLLDWYKENSSTFLYVLVQDGCKIAPEFNNYSAKSITTTDKSGIFIAAPNSHFNLEGLEKKSKFGFFNVTIQEVKDPVAFEYCINDICRIITKWGTDDDQSYLDPLLTNETLN